MKYHHVDMAGDEPTGMCHVSGGVTPYMIVGPEAFWYYDRMGQACSLCKRSLKKRYN